VETPVTGLFGAHVLVVGKKMSLNGEKYYTLGRENQGLERKKKKGTTAAI